MGAGHHRRVEASSWFSTECEDLSRTMPGFKERIGAILAAIRDTPEAAMVDPTSGWSVVFGEEVGLPVLIFYEYDEHSVVFRRIKRTDGE